LYNPKYESNDYDILDDDKAPVKAAKVIYDKELECGAGTRWE